MPVGAFLFDLGGVLVAEGEPVGRRVWERRLGLAEGNLAKIVTDATGPGWAGSRTEAEILRRIAQTTGLSQDDVRRLVDDFHSHEYLDPTLMAFVAEARPRYMVAAVSNAGPDCRPAMVRKFDLESLVDLLVVSAEEKVQKPDPSIYFLTAGRLGLSPGECVFIDDRPDNVEGARTTGMIGVLHTSSESTVATLHEHMAHGRSHPSRPVAR